MPLFGRQKTEEEQISTVEVELFKLVVNYFDGKITEKQLDDGFYKTIKNGFPAIWYAAEDVREAMLAPFPISRDQLPNIDMVELVYRDFFLKTMNRWLAEQR